MQQKHLRHSLSVPSKQVLAQTSMLHTVGCKDILKIQLSMQSADCEMKYM